MADLVVESSEEVTADDLASLVNKLVDATATGDVFEIEHGGRSYMVLVGERSVSVAGLTPRQAILAILGGDGDGHKQAPVDA